MIWEAEMKATPTQMMSAAMLVRSNTPNAVTVLEIPAIGYHHVITAISKTHSHHH
jgi:hypothetical protein